MEVFLKVIAYFLWFILYSVGGWIIETLLYIVVQKKVVKRGFLFGPLCPIYGVGAVLLTMLFYGKIDNIFWLFLAGMTLCTALEYVTHFVLEKLFHTTWWDYSQKRFNIKGRICLKNSLMFGAGAVLIVKVLQPFIIAMTEKIPTAALLWIGIALYSLLLIDVATTVAGLKDTVQTLKALQAMLGEHMQKGLDETDEHLSEVTERIRSNETYLRLTEQIRKKRSPLHRLYDRYPNFKLEHYKDALKVLFEKSDVKADEDKEKKPKQ